MGFRCVRVLAAMAALMFALLGLSACSPGVPGAAGSAFDSTVARADAAAAAGDADGALALYEEALATKEGSGRTSELAARVEAIKPLALSRRILAKTKPGPESVSTFVQVLQYAAGATETAAAAAGLSDSLSEYPRTMRADIVQMKKDINASKTIDMPLSTTLVIGLGPRWNEEVSQAPAPFGPLAKQAVADMRAAARAVQNAFDRTYAEGAMSDLTKAAKLCDTTLRELKALKSAK